MAKKLAVVGIFAYLNELLSAIEGLKKEKIPISAVYSPMRIEEIREALGEPPLGPGRFFTLTGAILGTLDRDFSCLVHGHPVAVHSGRQAPGPGNTDSHSGFRVFHSDSCVFYAGRFAFSEQDAEKAPARSITTSASARTVSGFWFIARRTTASRSRVFSRTLGPRRSVRIEE